MDEELMVEPETLEGQETGETSLNAPEADIEQLKKEAELAKNYKVRAEKAEALAAKLSNQVKQPAKNVLDVEDYIDISASLDGLDQREKEYLAQQHKYTNKPLTEIRKGEDFSLWQSAYRAKVEKERLTLSPSTTQDEAERPKTLTDRLREANLADKEKILVEAGLYKQPKRRFDPVNIGGRDLR